MSTGTYAIFGTEFTIQPTYGQWVNRNPIGISGDGHEIYGRTHEFECYWSLVSQDAIQQLNNYFLQVGISGTLVIALPEYGSSTYEFINYTGCTISELERRDYFSEHTKDVKLRIRNIVV
jgi:hypothetical protein